MVPNHSAASTNHFHLFHKSSCCKHHPAPSPPDYGMPPWDLLPPSAGPLRRGHFVWVFPSQSLPSLVYFPGELVASSPVGWRLRSVPPCMVIVSFPTKSWFHLQVLVIKQSLQIIDGSVAWPPFLHISWWHVNQLSSPSPSNIGSSLSVVQKGIAMLAHVLQSLWGFSHHL